MTPTRRDFLRLSATTAAWIASQRAEAQRLLLRSGRFRHAHIGVGGMGNADLKQIASHPAVEVVALCDVDRNHLEAAAAEHAEAKTYSDWRQLLREMADSIDGLCVSTPDHMHAPITLAALKLGKAVYCQKPLTHTVAEARRVAEAAATSGVVTQMGIQNHSAAHYRNAFELFRSGLTGPVSAVHVWSDRPAGWWPQGEDRPEGEDPIPETLDWDAWLGVAPERPFKAGKYHPFAWRGRKDFGTGAQGDMACHLMDPVPWFLELGAPSTVQSLGPKPTADCFPLWSQVQYRFPATRWTDDEGIDVTWHDGGRQPKEEAAAVGIDSLFANGSLFLGADGAMLISPYEPCRLFVDGKEVELESPGKPGLNHWHQWVDACLGEGQCSAPFEEAARLTAMALLGNVALEFPQQVLHWKDAEHRFQDQEAANALLDKTRRPGWE